MDGPAHRADGTLKDASEMEWDHSPSHNEVLPPSNFAPAPIKPLRFMPPLSFSNPTKRKQPPSEGHTQARVNNAAKQTAKKPKAIDCVNALNGASTEMPTSRPLPESMQPKKRRKGDGAADVLTVFNIISADDEEEKNQYDCTQCMSVGHNTPKFTNTAYFYHM